MKNVHVLPTDKPSRLFIYDGSLGFAKGFQYGSYAISNQHIYITSDEEIKEGDWFTDNNNSLKRSYKLSHVQFANPKKIILTTDQDLIKDGVQKIDDKFLEWFVKNPICDEIEIEKRKLLQGTTFYKIIIPKEEPKQETPEEETLSKIKFVISCNNDAQAIRLLEQYGQWQQERSYSEEEVLTLLRKRDKHTMNNLPIGKWLNPKDWFEKFKKR